VIKVPAARQLPAALAGGFCCPASWSHPLTAAAIKSVHHLILGRGAAALRLATVLTVQKVSRLRAHALNEGMGISRPDQEIKQ
jgi:hypothetical protein